jgi:uncharacterized protein YecT (DUF1311 family)
MRSALVLLLLSFLLSPAHAQPLTSSTRVERFCQTQRWPLWIAVCSDPELRALTVQRIEAYRGAAARLSPADRGALFENQKSWTASYRRGCGMVPGVAPTIPLAPEMRSCLIRGARARVTYLRTYGAQEAAIVPPWTAAAPLPSEGKAVRAVAASSTAGAGAPAPIGPSFDCSKAAEPSPK